MYNDSVVHTTHGPVRGRVLDGVHVFQGIRYGADTGAYRFLPPQPPQPWTDVANAFAYGPTAPQDHPDTGTDRALNPFLQKIGLTDNLPESEDCLFANVWTPGADAAGRPVMVWVHSGGFSSNSGSSPAIDGARLAARGDVVVITFNHRLNVLGYAHLTDDPQSPFASAGNAGMLDIVALLEWVRDNAPAFGGDPGNVTVFGQSGGAMKISALLAMPAARGLFHRAILQSGSAPRLSTPAEGRAAAHRLFERLGLEPDDVDALRRMPLPELMRAYAELAAEGGALMFGAVTDGVTIPSDPLDPQHPDTCSSVPLIVGDLDTEMSLFTIQRPDNLSTITFDGARARVASALGSERDADDLLATFRDRYPDASAYEILVRIMSSAVFTGPTEQLAERAARRADSPVWRYRITWRTPVDDGLLMSPHELDVALTFGNVEVAAGLNGGGDDAWALSSLLQESWLAFARSGDPRAGGIAEWPAYSLERRETLVLSPQPGVVTDVDGDIHAATRAATGAGVDWFRA